MTSRRAHSSATMKRGPEAPKAIHARRFPAALADFIAVATWCKAWIGGLYFQIDYGVCMVWMGRARCHLVAQAQNWERVTRGSRLPRPKFKIAARIFFVRRLSSALISSAWLVWQARFARVCFCGLANKSWKSCFQRFLKMLQCFQGSGDSRKLLNCEIFPNFENTYGCHFGMSHFFRPEGQKHLRSNMQRHSNPMQNIFDVEKPKLWHTKCLIPVSRVEEFLRDFLQKWHVDHRLDLRIPIHFNDFEADASKVLRLPRKSWAEA